MVQGLIVTVGTSVEPIRIAVSQPGLRAAAFLCTSETEAIAQSLIPDHPGLEARTAVFADEPESTVDLLRAIQDQYRWLQALGIPREAIRVDLTGGRKWMSATATMAACQLGVDLQYVVVDYSDRSPVAGSERVVTLPNPITESGHVEYALAQGFARGYRFESASKVLADFVPHIQFSDDRELFEGLSKLYATLHVWDLFGHFSRSLLADFEEALSAIERSLRTRPRNAERFKEFLAGMRQVAQRSEEIFRAGRPSALAIADLVENAHRRLKQGSSDDAMARVYRAVEAVAQWRLMERYRIVTSNMDYARFSDEVLQAAELEERPMEIGLRQSWELLRALGDDLVKVAYGNEKAGSFKFGKVIEIRNASLLAHGWNPMAPNEVEKALMNLDALLGDLGSQVPRLTLPNLPDLYA